MEGRECHAKVMWVWFKFMIINENVFAGYFLEPTVFTDVRDEMMVAKEESFGPIMIISTFENG